MSAIIVTDAGFAPEDWQGEFLALDGLEAAAEPTPPAGRDGQADAKAHAAVPSLALDLAGDTGAAALARLASWSGWPHRVALLRIRFPNFADGRGLTLARQLRRLGFDGRLRAVGPLLPDQYAMLRRAGFDEVEITKAHAARHAQAHWLARANWRAHDHQARLRAAAPAQTASTAG